MKRLVIFGGFALLIVVGLVTAMAPAQKAAKILQKPAKIVKPAGPGSDNGFLGAYIVPDMREFGEAAATLEEAEARVGHKIKLADEKLAGGKPIFRTQGTSAVMVYPSGVWYTSGEFRWPGQDPRDVYTKEVESDKRELANAKDLQNRPAELDITNEARDIAGRPGEVCEKGNNRVDGKLFPRPAFAQWYEDGLEYKVFGATDMPLSQIIPIAESIANRN